MARKLKFAFYWAASCGGCEVAVLDTDAKILDVAAAADIYLWPVALDHKYADVKKLADRFVDVAFINGAVRNSEQEELVKLLRQKSAAVVAFGSCACFGGIPALANLYSRDEILRRAYLETPSTVNPKGESPRTAVVVPEGELELPRFFGSVYQLDEIIPVEYYLPGCPPPADLVARAVEAVIKGNLPAPGAVLAGPKALCQSCPREKSEKRVDGFVRVHEAVPDAKKCLLEQGIVCLGPATMDGCGARCIEANMPCRGCFGPTAEAIDQGAKMLSGIATALATKDEAAIRAAMDRVPDPAGTFYRFTMSRSLLKTKRAGRTAQGKELAAS